VDQLAEEPPVLAVVQEEAGLPPRPAVHHHADAVVVHGDGPVPAARQQPRFHLQSLETAEQVGVPQDHRVGAEAGRELFRHQARPPLHAGHALGDHQDGAVAVRHEPRQAVALTEDEARHGRARPHPLPPRQCRFQPPPHQRRIRFAIVEIHHPHGDVGQRIGVAHAQELAGARLEAHRLAGRHPGERCGVEVAAPGPAMAAADAGVVVLFHAERAHGQSVAQDNFSPQRTQRAQKGILAF